MHAWDMTTEKGAMGLHSLLSAKSNALSGVINGIDTEEWNPETDEFIYSRYTSCHTKLIISRIQNKISKLNSWLFLHFPQVFIWEHVR